MRLKENDKTFNLNSVTQKSSKKACPEYDSSRL
jgi:hypothetical protein